MKIFLFWQHPPSRELVDVYSGVLFYVSGISMEHLGCVSSLDPWHGDN